MKHYQFGTKTMNDALYYEEYVIALIEKKWNNKGIKAIKTSCSSVSHIDAILYKNDKAIALAEIKSRDYTLDQLNEYGSIILSYDKIQSASVVCSYLQLPYLFFAYIKPNDVLLYWKILDINGQNLFKYTVKQTTTAEHCNGGSVVRHNAYLPMSNSFILQ